MRIFEIILKLLFLAGSIYFISTGSIQSVLFPIFLMICPILGVVLILNKRASYNFKQTKRDLLIRQIEGAALLIFPALLSFM